MVDSRYFTAISPAAFDKVLDRLLTNFPETGRDFASSHVPSLLSRLAQHYWSLGSPLGDQSPYFKAVQLAPQALQALELLCFPQCIPETIDNIDDLDDDAFFVKKKSQRDRKKAKRSRAATVDTTPLEKLGWPLPKSKVEAENLSSLMIREQKAALQVCASSKKPRI